MSRIVSMIISGISAFTLMVLFVCGIRNSEAGYAMVGSLMN